MKMRLFILALGWCVCSAWAAVHVVVDSQTITGHNESNVVARLIWLGEPGTSGSRIVSVRPVELTNDVSGQSTFSNVVFGTYRLELETDPRTTLRLVVSTNLDGTYYASALRATSNAPAADPQYLTLATGDARYLPTPVTNLSVGNLTLTTGTNAVSLVATPDGAQADGTLVVSNLIVGGYLTLGGAASNSWPSGGGSSTNTVTGIVSTPEVVLLSTNNVFITGTNLLVLGTVSNYNRAVLGTYTNANGGAGTIPPLSNYRIQISTNGGSSFFTPAETAPITVPTIVALNDENGPSYLGWASNITVYGYSNTTLIGYTVDLAGQNLFVDDPTNSRGVVNLATAQILAQSNANYYVGNWSTYTAVTRPKLAGLGLDFSAKWSAYHTSATNTSSLNFGPFGTNLLTLTANDVTTTNTSGALYIASAYLSGTNVVLLVSVTNVVAPIIPQSSTNINNTNSWTDIASYTSSYPYQTNGVYWVTFPQMTGTNYFRVRSLVTQTNAYSTVRQVTVNGDLSVSGNAVFETSAHASSVSGGQINDGENYVSFGVRLNVDGLDFLNDNAVFGKISSPSAGVLEFGRTADSKVTVSNGVLIASSVSGDGAALTNLNANQLTSGTVPPGRLTSAGTNLPNAVLTSDGSGNRFWTNIITLTNSGSTLRLAPSAIRMDGTNLMGIVLTNSATSNSLAYTNGGLTILGPTAAASLAGVTITNALVYVTGTRPMVAITNSSDSVSYFGTYDNLFQFSYNRNPATGVIPRSDRTASYVNVYGANGVGYISFHTANVNNTSPSEVMRVSGNGGVAIGYSASPTAALDVSGSGKFSGTITATNGVTLPAIATAPAGITNGLAAFWNSNGVVYLRTSVSGYTTNMDTKLAP